MTTVGQATPAGEVAERPREQADDGIRCLRCGHVVTHRHQAIAVGGSHAHTFRNPAGWSFRVGCFRRAAGAGVSGQATDEHTWFPGYAWRYAHCGGCAAHLGWWFVGPGDAFACLILSRLA